MKHLNRSLRVVPIAVAALVLLSSSLAARNIPLLDYSVSKVRDEDESGGVLFGLEAVVSPAPGELQAVSGSLIQPNNEERFLSFGVGTEDRRLWVPCDSEAILEARCPSGTYRFDLEYLGEHHHPALMLAPTNFPPTPRIANWRAGDSVAAGERMLLAWDILGNEGTNDYADLLIHDSLLIHRTAVPGSPDALAFSRSGTVLTVRPSRSDEADFLVHLRRHRVTDRRSSEIPGAFGFASYASGGPSVRIRFAPDSRAPGLLSTLPANGTVLDSDVPRVLFQFDEPMERAFMIQWSTNVIAGGFRCGFEDAEHRVLGCSYEGEWPEEQLIHWTLNPTSPSAQNVVTGTASNGGSASFRDRAGNALSPVGGTFRTPRALDRVVGTNVTAITLELQKYLFQSDTNAPVASPDSFAPFSAWVGIGFDGRVPSDTVARFSTSTGDMLAEYVPGTAFPGWGRAWELVGFGELETDFETEVDVLEAFPGDQYTLSLSNRFIGSRAVRLNLGTSFPDVPRIANLDAAQSIRSGESFTLRWDDPHLKPGDFVFLHLQGTTVTFHVDSETAGSSLTHASTAFTLPAGTLLPNQTYRGYLGGVRITGRDAAGVPGARVEAGLGCYVDFEIRTLPESFVVSPETLPRIEAGKPCAFEFAASGALAPLRWSLVAGSKLPEGVVLDPAGRLSGVPSRAGAYVFGVAVDSGLRPAFGGHRVYRLDVTGGSQAIPARLGRPRLTAGGGFAFEATGTPGSTHQVEASSDLSSWVPSSTITLPPEGVITVTNGLPSGTIGSARFYRLTTSLR